MTIALTRAPERSGRSMRIRLAALLTALITVLVVVPVASASATTVKFYINNDPGVSCSNSNAGTLPSAPWCDLEPVDGETLFAGTQLLMACGQTWTQSPSQTTEPWVRLTGDGAGGADNIVIDAYDPADTESNDCAGDRPHVVGNSDPESILFWVDDATHWRISNLELSDGGVGLRMYYTTLGNQDVELSNLLVRDFQGTYRGSCTTYPYFYTSSGILFDNDSTLDPDAPDYIVDGVTLRNIEGTGNQASIALAGYGCVGGDRFSTHHYVNVDMSNLYLHDDDGPADGCSDGLQMVHAENVRIYDSWLENEAACATGTGTAAIFFAVMKHVDLFNNVIIDTPYTNSFDETGIDYEGFIDDIDTYNNYVGGHSGPGLELLAIHGYDDFSINTNIENNFFIGNGRYRETGSIKRYQADTDPAGVIDGNLYAEQHGFLTTGFGGNFDEFTITDNVPVTGESYAARDFAGDQDGLWRYEYTTNGGTTWSDMTWDATAQRWTVPSVLYEGLGRFDWHPGSCSGCSVARTWIAPSDGEISIRGRAAKSTAAASTGVGVTVYNGSTAVVPRQVVNGGDTVGLDTNADGVAVDAGDEIRFVLDNNGDWSFDSTTWVPAVAYTSGLACDSAIVENCGFETPVLTPNTWQWQPTGSGVEWTFGPYTGINTNGNGYTYLSPLAPEGDQVGFIQGTQAIEQTVTVSTAGDYRLVFSAAQRQTQNQDVEVWLDSTLLGTYQPRPGWYQLYVTVPISLTTGSHTLEFVGLNTVGGDNTVLLDNISLQLL